MTPERRIARGIAYVERCKRDHDDATPQHPLIAGYWRMLSDDYASALDVLRAAAPLPDALERICIVARLQIGGGSRERQFLWHKIASAMGVHFDPPGRTRAAP